MKLFKPFFYIAVTLAATAMTSCSKEEDNNAAATYEAPSITSSEITLTLPAALTSQSNAAATQAANYAAMVNILPSALDYLSTIPKEAETSNLKSSGKRYKWTQTSTNYTIWLEVTEDALTKYYNYYINKTSAEIGGRSLIVNMRELKTKLGGGITFAYQNDTLNYNYTKSGTGISATLVYKTSSVSYYFALTINTNNSGSFLGYEGTNTSGTKFIDISWNISGHGSYAVKEETGTF
jgi:hypothetical protein